MNRPEPTWMTIDELAALVADDPNQIMEWIAEDRIPYAYHPDGILVWWEGFQMIMTEIYDLETMLAQIHEVVGDLTDEEIDSWYDERDLDDV